VRIDARFVKSAAGRADFPRDRLPEIALVGRSNVGKSSLINALVRQRLARTSGAPGKTRLANVYRVDPGRETPLYLVDLPGYGYARGGADTAREFDEVTRAFWKRAEEDDPVRIAALLIVDVRHPGLSNDIRAWGWLESTFERRAIVATKIDKLARGQRIRAMRELESVFEDSVVPVSAATGEGLEELWKLIDRLANSSKPEPLRSRRPPKATAPLAPRK